MSGRSSSAILRVVSRGSALALWQAEHVRAALDRDREAATELVVVRTTGDRVQDVPLSRIGERGLFTKEVDDALLDDRADLAVHSAKDVPTVLPDGLEITAFLEREDPADALVTAANGPGGLADLRAGTRVGTSSLRRRAQLLASRPDVTVVDLRGNVDTRLVRVREGLVDATILARAGLLRLGRAAEAAQVLSPPAWLPAVAQGALALVMRADDPGRERVAALDHAPTRAAVTAERAFLRGLEGGCQIPIGALARVADGELELQGGVFSLDGSVALRDSVRGPANDPEAVGNALADRMLRRGAAQVLANIRASSGNALPQVPEP